MAEIKTYDSFDEMAEELQRQSDKARKFADKYRLWEQNLQGGDFFVESTDYGLMYGEVFISRDPEDKEIEKRSRENGYIFSRVFSSLCPQGELGSVHISRIFYKITKEGFDQAKKQGFPSDNLHLLEASDIIDISPMVLEPFIEELEKSLKN